MQSYVPFWFSSSNLDLGRPPPRPASRPSAGRPPHTLHSTIILLGGSFEFMEEVLVHFSHHAASNFRPQSIGKSEAADDARTYPNADPLQPDGICSWHQGQKPGANAVFLCFCLAPPRISPGTSTSPSWQKCLSVLTVVVMTRG